MKTWMRRIGICVGILVVLLCWPAGLIASQRDVSGALPPTGRAADSPAAKSAAIPWSQIGATASQQYSGDGLGVGASAGGARLRCGLQRLEGEATSEGLWLTSTVTGQASDPSSVAALRRVDRFQVVAAAVGRGGLSVERGALERRSVGAATHALCLADAGMVTIEGQRVRFVRPGLTEEYSVGVDGVRQDFVVQEKPEGAGEGELCLRLAVTGARVERAGQGAQLVLEKSGRKIAYSRLRVSDATGQELPARMEVQRNSECRMQNAEFDLAVVVDDTQAAYPLRIDPTFSDANWISMGGIPGVGGPGGGVYAAVTDASGNLYAGGTFMSGGSVVASHVAKWGGSSWSALGSGMNGAVNALAVSGSDLYAGGSFTVAGGVPATNVAKWNGSSWSALGSGITGPGSVPPVSALAVSGSDLYAAGYFTSAGGTAANCIAKWNGSSWSALGSGIDGPVNALAVSGSDLYAGGTGFGLGIVKWDGSNWSTLGSVVISGVYALAVSGSNVYAGGIPGAVVVKWDGSSWSYIAYPSSYSYYSVSALAVSGSNLYAGGDFAGYIAKWDGSSWSALGSGMNGTVFALAVSGANLYAGGIFTTAGGKSSPYTARAVLGDTPGYNQLTGRPSPVAGMQLSYVGDPATNYALDRTFNLSPPISWVGQATNTMSISGVLTFYNRPVSGTNNFWRVRSVP